jgi:beta-lactamase superfamily II metal-dependent hydrolase
MNFFIKHRKITYSFIFSAILICAILSLSVYFVINNHKEIGSIVDINNSKEIANEISEPDGKLQLNFSNLGEGDAVYIRTSSNKNIVLLSGIIGDSSSLVEQLKEQGIKSIDYLISVYSDDRLIGAVSDMVQAVPVGSIILPVGSGTGDSLKTLTDSGRIIEYVDSEKTLTVDSVTSVELMKVNDSLCFVGLSLKNENLVLYGKEEFLALMGPEAGKIEAGLLKVDYSTSSTPVSIEMLDIIKPKSVILSVSNTSADYPDASTMQMLRKKGVTIYRTDESGMITVVDKEGSLEFKSNPGTYAYRSDVNKVVVAVPTLASRGGLTTEKKKGTVIKPPAVNVPKPTPTPAPKPTPAPTPKPTPVPTPTPTPTPIPDNSLIMGKSTATPEQLARYLLSKNPSPKINCSAYELASYFISEGAAEGVRGDIAFAQACKETGFFKYGGIALPEWNNYCGLGVTGAAYDPGTAVETQYIPGVIVIRTPFSASVGIKFAAPQLGVRAQIQHLKGYATTARLNNTRVDPRYVARGNAPRWIDLNGRWAVPGTTYGQDILGIFNRIMGY